MVRNAMVTDSELIRRYVGEKSEAAFAELVQRHLDLVYSAALRRLAGDTHAAADGTQLVFTALARQSAALTRGVVLPGWLYATTRNVAVDFIRTEQRRRAREQEAHTMQETISPSEPTGDWEQLRPLLDAAMDELGNADREAVLLRFFAKRPFTEIGAALRVSEDAARMRVERALEKLRAVLARRGATSTSAVLAVALSSEVVVAAPVGLGAVVTAGAVIATSGTAAVTAGAFTFMSMSKIVVGMAVAIAAVGVGCAIYQLRTAAQVRDDLVSLRQEHAAVRAKALAAEANLRTTEQEAATAKSRVAVLVKNLESAKANPSPAAAPGPTAGATTVNNVFGKPGYARLKVEKFRASLALRYDPLYRALNLTPEQVAKFEAALTAGFQGTVDVWAAAAMEGIAVSDNNTPTGTSLARMTADPHEVAQRAVETLLGEERYEKYRQFDKLGSVRELVTTLAGGVYHSESPLTAQQGEALAGILSANTKIIKTPMADDGKKPIFSISEETDWDAVTTQAQSILSATQLNTLRSLAAQTRAELEMRRILNPPVAPAAKTPGG